MIDFYNALKTIIQRGEYSLENMEDRINTCWLDTRITTEQRDELLTLAAECAKDEWQVDVLGKLAELEARVYELEHKDDPDPAEQYPVWEQGMITPQHGIVRWDVTGDGEYDLCRYDGRRSQGTASKVGGIEGWHLLDAELNATHTIKRNSDGTYTLTPIEPEPESE